MSAPLKKMLPWMAWLALSLVVGAYLYSAMYSSAVAPTVFLPGETTDGHYQIEMACSACHDNEAKDGVFTSEGVTNSACKKCHGDDLEAASDSHPTRKFKNPENAVFLQHVDAMQCVDCHKEHDRDRTFEMGVTLPENFCAHCHEVTLENLESHKELSFSTCATSGCHNYHDNVPLAPSFLLKHYGEPDHIVGGKLPSKDERKPCPEPWSDPIDMQSCKSCHDSEVTGFLKGKHGMRLSVEGLEPMVVGDARSPMKAAAAHASLSCKSCHDQPGADRSFVTHQSCVGCHDSEHTRNYETSRHAQLWSAELAGGSPGTGVSCASCHMPHLSVSDGAITINHNQSENLKPSEKMLQQVCMSCHGMEFAMSALADEDLITKNFVGNPSERHPGVQWSANAALKRDNKAVAAIKDYLDSIGGAPPSHGPRKPPIKPLEDSAPADLQTEKTETEYD